MFSPYEKGIAPMSASDEFNVTHGEFREGENELWQRILEAWGSMRASTSRLLAEKPSEGRLLFYVLLSDLIFFVSWSLKTLLYPGESAAGPVPVQMGYWLVIAMFFRTSCLYFFSIATRLVQIQSHSKKTPRPSHGTRWARFEATKR